MFKWQIKVDEPMESEQEVVPTTSFHQALPTSFGNSSAPAPLQGRGNPLNGQRGPQMYRAPHQDYYDHQGYADYRQRPREYMNHHGPGHFRNTPRGNNIPLHNKFSPLFQYREERYKDEHGITRHLAQYNDHPTRLRDGYQDSPSDFGRGEQYRFFPMGNIRAKRSYEEKEALEGGGG